ncbi:Gfo/Idh/MocA family oxidoreductase [Neolewinella lacunae]|uniref:Gfo/Idh/MocA family oxidoreductase n=1 Tax=Neolewinella lacunae TaxID=1517758 RepID=A0A923TAQ8_9BACT|nr:Gfo/Idh/MocA family oxidoreductase [Neolewinella lacunae]MBC6996746.1 Gfo/Idh/MocA family oxidoreductase [Neolewinella lacunae]MDN3633389.1 Gfo/Idh/MocA family oxidoreductase [Neolewinella lacunae]
MPQSRRSFLKKTTALAGGLAISSQIAAKAYAGGTDVIRVGLIGCGGRGTGAAAQALSTTQNVRLVAMSDAFRDRLDESYRSIQGHLADNDLDAGRLAVSEEHKFVGFEGYRKVIELSDVVLIATPPGFRPAHFEAAVNAGKHVFMEKPLAVDAPGVRRVLQAAEAAKAKKLNVVVGLQRHYEKLYTGGWVDMLQNGVIGDITASYVYWNSGGVWVRPRQAGQTEMEYQMRNWYYFNWLCGDHINEQHIHNLDVGNWVKQAYPVTASGYGGRHTRNGKEHGEIFDHHFVEYTYADGSKMISQCRHWNGCADKVSEGFQGTNGSAPQPGKIMAKSGYVLLDHNSRKDPNPYQVEHDVLFEAVAKGDYKFADAENGAKSTMTAIMGRMATYSGQVINWDEAMASSLDLSPKQLDFNAEPPILPLPSGFYPVPVPGETKVF